MSKTAFDMNFDVDNKGNQMSKAVFDTYEKRFNEYVNDDLDMPKALALVWEIVKDANLEEKEKRDLILDFDRVLGLKLDESANALNKLVIPENVKRLIDERDKARAEKDFAKSDKLRAQIESLGFEVMDTSEGTVVNSKNNS